MARAWTTGLWTLCAAVLFAAAPGLCGAVDAAPVKGEINVSTSGGYARLVFRFAEEVEAEVRASNNILIIAFKKPVDVSVDRITIGAAGYVGAARRDPDGSAVRIALARKVTINSMAAGERLFVDLLPETWTGVAPGLPQEVIDELTKRARDAEKRARDRQQLAQQKFQTPIRVRVGQQPTFTRFVFELPSLITIAADRAKEKLSILFDAPLVFDLAEAKGSLPSTIAAIDTETGPDTATVQFTLIGPVDVRTFREDNNYVLDIVMTERTGARSEVPTQPSAADLGVARESAMSGGESESAPPRVGQPPLTVAAAEPAASAAPVPRPRPQAAPSRAGTTDPAERSEPDEKKAAANRQVPADPDDRPSAPASAPEKRIDAAPQPDAATQSELASVSAPTPVPSSALAAAPVAPAPTAVVQGSAEPTLKARDPHAPVVAEIRRQGDALKLTFPFAVPTAAAVFRRFDTLWFVVDANVPIDVGALSGEASQSIRSAEVSKSGDSQIVRIRLDRPKLASLGAEGTAWTITLGDVVLDPTRPLGIMRNVAGGRSNVSIPFEEPQRLHRIVDPDVGDAIVVVTGFAPARGFLKPQDFVEFRALASTHGVALQPLSDDLQAELAIDRILVGRPGGLTLSTLSAATANGQALRASAGSRPMLLDPQLWGFDREAPFLERRDQLTRAAAEAPEAKRAEARLALARFYLAREMYPEAKSVVDVTLSEKRATAEDPSVLVLRAMTNLMMGRADDALKDLANPIVGNQLDAPLWRALALARQGKWVEARESYRAGEAAIATLPIELQRMAVIEGARAAVEVKDYGDAARLLNEFDVLAVPRELEATLAVLKGRVDEGLGRISDALVAYRTAADSWDRPHAAQGRLREIALRASTGDLNRADAIAGLETLTTIWRGDATEVEALQLLAKFYTEEGRYRDAFQVMRMALTAHPRSDMTRRIQEGAASTFDSLFLTSRGDAMPALDAVSLFYDFRELTPIGRRGDEMIRRLADRLVSVDLLDQAAELLQHQVSHRLQGAARANVGIRLAVVHLMNRKPERALRALHETRSGEVTNDVRHQRLLLEARALSDTGRTDLALEVIEGLQGREIDRLRADILWSARRWREAAEQIEKYYGARWRDFAPLNQPERNDILRAAIGYALADDALGIDRFREKYLPKMSETSDKRAFEIVTSPAGEASGEFKEVAQSAGATNTLDGFLRELRARYPDFGATTPAPPDAQTRPPEVARGGQT